MMLPHLPMPAFLNPFSFFLACLAGWLNQHQQIVIDYLSMANSYSCGNGCLI
jgi:hypothetical protein